MVLAPLVRVLRAPTPEAVIVLVAARAATVRAATPVAAIVLASKVRSAPAVHAPTHVALAPTLVAIVLRSTDRGATRVRA